MIIQDIMQKDVIYIQKNTSIQAALNLMKQHRIRHLPIVNESDEIIGIISDRDLKEASPSIFQENNESLLLTSVEKVMISDVLTALPYDFVEEAANTMIEHQISCLPIEDAGKLIGIITETDLLQTLVTLTGADQPTSRLEVKVPNKKGMLSDIASIIKKHNINIQSALVYPAKDPNKKILVFRLQTMDLRLLSKELTNEQYDVVWPIDMELKS
ncbi:acetoin utilization AcuB family protein [Bacillus shivajii]|uniref:acetoin utilization AcuB family protein n=1 Tax=Bacillus shivajii TaxID=1983719 RepID=UPI001CFAD9CE|nr:acetoin utilization AcuB family protein [Bacillus shivajii]UCZ52304.1 acetoin utilization AcuB family protein [Bacillus shivajii]